MPLPSPLKGELLLGLAREAIGERLGLGELSNPSEAFLMDPGATFITLMKAQELRGCMGSIEAHRALLKDLRDNARAAAFGDPRFDPLTEIEFPQISVEVSLLSALEELTAHSEQEALKEIRPGTDGLVLKAGYHRGTFLPQVWEQLPDPKDFLRHLRLKADLPPSGWEPDYQLLRYTVAKWKEKA